MGNCNFGTYPNVAQMTIKKSDGSFHAVRMKDNPPTSPKPAGSLIMIGNLDKNGITTLDAVATEKIPSTWKITENGNKIDVDAPNKVRIDLPESEILSRDGKSVWSRNDKKRRNAIRTGKPPFFIDE